nr:glycine-rich protein [Nannocystis pusilla]
MQGKVTVTAGIQSWTVPVTGTYRIEAWGAEGGTQSQYGPGGKGAHVRGDVALAQGEVLRILVGQMGKTGMYYDVGGGGGSFVVKTMGNVPLIVAGGGGAPGNCGVADMTAQNGKGVDGANGNGGTSGNDGTWCGCGGDGSAGGGFNTDGGGNGGKSFMNGGKGADTERPGQCIDSGLGGFGGGGNGGNGGPGGGGYQGGDAGGSGAGGIAYGTGGKSFTSGANKLQEDGVRAGHGQVKITLL